MILSNPALYKAPGESICAQDAMLEARGVNDHEKKNLLKNATIFRQFDSINCLPIQQDSHDDMIKRIVFSLSGKQKQQRSHK